MKNIEFIASKYESPKVACYDIATIFLIAVSGGSDDDGYNNVDNWEW